MQHTNWILSAALVLAGCRAPSDTRADEGTTADEAALAEQAGPPAVAAGEQHAWLKNLVGEWEAKIEAGGPSDASDAKPDAIERIHAIGDLWTVAESEGSYMGMRVKSQMTLGYDPEKKRFVGTWVDSNLPHLWIYDGALDVSGKTLTLEAEGPIEPGKSARFRDAITVVSRDEKLLTSSMEGEDGSWTTFATVRYRRTK